MTEMTLEHALRLAFDLHRRGRLDEAEEIYRQVLDQQPETPDALHLLGLARQQRGRHEEAAQLISRAIALDPAQGEFHYNLGNSLLHLRRREEAERAFARAVERSPTLAPAWHNLGHLRLTDGRPRAAAEAYAHAIAAQPTLAEAHNGLGMAQKDLGRLDEALAAFRAAVRHAPLYHGAHSNLVYALHFDPAQDAATILAEHVEWSRRHADALSAAAPPHDNDRSPERRLRIGYVSPDFREHPIGLSMLPILANHDRDAFDVSCFCDVSAPDAVTAQLRGHSPEWHDTRRLNDAQLADFVRSRKIDVLIDLTAHMHRGRLLAFARRPAPVQVSFLAYPATTGLRAMGWRISDRHLDPPGETEPFNSESLLRLPNSFWCYPDVPDAPPADPAPPAEANGFVTFGSLNNPCKITPPTIELWSRVLRAVPRSRLLLLSLDEQPEGDHRAEQFAQLGVARERIELVGKQPRQAYLRTYGRIDVVLDPLPYNGHFTSCDALFMGVPVVSLRGRTSVGRAGASILSTIGLPELLAGDADQFITIAAALAGDRPRLAHLRRTLRALVKQSPLMDGAALTRGVESAYRSAWQAWCGNAASSGSADP